MNAYLFGIAAMLSFFSYFFVNLVMCTFCSIPGCGLYSVVIGFFVLVGTWAFLLFNETK